MKLLSEKTDVRYKSFKDFNDTFQCSFSQGPYSKAVGEVEVPSPKR